MSRPACRPTAPPSRRYGFTLHPLDWRRGSTNPFDRLRIIGEVRRLYRNLKPDLVHHVALQPTVIGSLAALGIAGEEAECHGGARLRLHLAHARRRLLVRLCRARPAALPFQHAATRPCWCRIRTIALRMPRSALTPDRMFLIAGIRRRYRSVDADAGAGGPGDRWLCRPAARRQGSSHADRRARPSRSAAASGPASDRRRAAIRPIRLRFRSEEIDSWTDASPASKCSAMSRTSARSGRAAHIAVLPSRREGLAEEPAGSRRLRAADRRHRRAGLPRDRTRTMSMRCLVPPDDPAALADAIDSAGARSGVEAELRRCRPPAWWRRSSPATRIGQEIVALYDDLLGLGKPALLRRTAAARLNRTRKAFQSGTGREINVAHGRKIAVIGLGYVGLPVAVAFARSGVAGDRLRYRRRRGSRNCARARTAPVRSSRPTLSQAEPAL